MPMARCAIGGSGCDELAAVQAADHVAAALAQRADAERRGRRRADEVDRRRRCPAASGAASGARVLTVSLRAQLRAAAASLASSMSQATMFFTPLARSTETPIRPRPPQPSTATRPRGPSSGSLAVAL